VQECSKQFTEIEEKGINDEKTVQLIQVTFSRSEGKNPEDKLHTARQPHIASFADSLSMTSLAKLLLSTFT
jgi:hypothetical protein